MVRNQNEKHEARARAARTGEPYTAALEAVRRERADYVTFETGTAFGVGFIGNTVEAAVAEMIAGTRITARVTGRVVGGGWPLVRYTGPRDELLAMARGRFGISTEEIEEFHPQLLDTPSVTFRITADRLRPVTAGNADELVDVEAAVAKLVTNTSIRAEVSPPTGITPGGTPILTFTGPREELLALAQNRFWLSATDLRAFHPQLLLPHVAGRSCMFQDCVETLESNAELERHIRVYHLIQTNLNARNGRPPAYAMFSDDGALGLDAIVAHVGARWELDDAAAAGDEVARRLRALSAAGHDEYGDTDSRGSFVSVLASACGLDDVDPTAPDEYLSESERARAVRFRTLLLHAGMDLWPLHAGDEARLADYIAASEVDGGDGGARRRPSI